MSKIMMGSKLSTRLQNNEDINISTLSDMVPINDNTWLIDSGASKQMIGIRNHLTDVALVFGTGERRGRGDASPGRPERTPKFFRGRRVGDDNNIYIKKY
jgi:hypothetical protein